MEVPIKKFIEILGSKEYDNYKEAQSEIEQNKNLTSKTLKSIERAGKDLYSKNLKYLYLKESIVNAIPMSAKVIDLFFGKLPGILADYGSNLVTDFLKLNKTIPIYNCNGVMNEVFKDRVIKKFTAANSALAHMAGRSATNQQ